MTKLLILAALFSTPAFAVSEKYRFLQPKLTELAAKCATFERTEPAGGACDLNPTLAKAKTACAKMQEIYTEAQDKAVNVVQRAKFWMETKGTRRETSTHVVILFDLSSDPSYPFHDTDAVVNGALQASLLAIYSVDEDLTALDKSRVCRKGEAKKRYEKLWQEWNGDGKSISNYHGDLGMAVSDYLMQAQRAMESGAFNQAIDETSKENAGITIKRAR